jgi:hypothetical protein
LLENEINPIMKDYQIRTLLTMCLLSFCTAGRGQQTAEKRLRIYNAIISTPEQQQKLRGVLLEVHDSAVTIISKDVAVRIPATSIREIKIKRKAAVGRGAAVGGLTGFGLGLIIGFASGDDQCPPGSWCIYQATAEEKALGGGLVLGAGGTIIGVIIGAASRAEKIKINNDPRIFRNNLERLKKYLKVQ